MKAKLILVIASIFGILSLQAQSIANYTFVPSSSTFTPLVGGINVPSVQADDANSTALPIGFTFYYMGVAYTQVYAGSNGYLSFNAGSTGVSTAQMRTNALNASPAAMRPVLAALWDDLDVNGTGAIASYQTSGLPGSQVFTFEWLNYSPYVGVATPASISFQIKLYEADGSVEFLYRPEAGVTPLASASIGITAIPTGINNFQSLNNTSAAPTASLTAETTTITTYPAAGQSYKWNGPGATPTAAVNITFTGVTATAMTVNWVDNSTTETFFTVQRSLDGLSYATVGTVNSTTMAGTGTGYNFPATGLSTSTLYYWRIIAGNESSAPSAPLDGTQMTLAGTMCGTYTVGPTGAYTSLTAAFADLSLNGILCPVNFELQAAYVSTVETFPLNVPGLGASAINTIVVRPELGATNLSITSNSAQTINYNGGSFVSFDGRPGGLGTVSQLTISNTSTTGNAIKFIGGSTNNGITYCNVTGVTTSTTAGVIFLSTGVNTNNSFNNNDIRSGATNAANLIYSSGSANSNTTIQSNLIHNFTSNGISNTNGNNWTIGGVGLGNNVYQEASRTAAFTCINISNGNNHVVSFNNIYQTAGVNTGANNGIAVTGGGTGHTINDNSIGGANASRTGSAMYSTAGSTSNGINVTAGTGTTTNIYNNRISNWGVLTAIGTTGGTANGILVGGGTLNIGTLGGNVLGGAVITGIPSDTLVTSYDNGWINVSAGTVVIENNTVSNASYYRGANDRNAGMTITSTGTIIRNNTVAVLKGNNTSTIGSSFITTGIYTTGTNNILENNTISDIYNFNSVSSAVHVTGINFLGGTGAIIRNNRISNIRSSGTQTGTNSPIANGIYISTGNPAIYNNRISIGLNTGGEARVSGIQENSTSNPGAAIQYNSIYVNGTSTSGANNSYAYQRTSTSASSFRNNIFYNERTGGTGNHYAIGNLAGTPATNWTATTSDYNFFVTANSATVGEWGAGVANTFTQFQTISAGEVNSKNDLSSFLPAATLFVDPTTANLKINPAYYTTPSQIESKGTVIAVTTDFESDSRPGPAGSVNGGGTAPDMGADEFDGTPIQIDMGVIALVNPLTTGCHTSTETVRVRLHNYSTQTIDFSIHPVTITSSVTGPNPVVFTNLILNTGTLAGGANLDTAVAFNYDMTAVGVYGFNASAAVTGDGGAGNDAMTQVNINVSGGTATAAPGSICAGATTTLAVTGNTNGATVQWQISQDAVSWSNIASATTSPYVYTDLSTGPDTLYFRSVSCGTDASVIDTAIINFVTSATTFDTSRCGAGYLDIHATGSGLLNWFNVPSGGTSLDTGIVYTPFLSVTDTFYVENSTGTSNGAHTTTYAAGNGSSGNCFTIKALTTITVTNFDGHTSTTAPGNWEIWYRPNDFLLTPGSHLSNVGWTQLGTATNVPQLGNGLVTPIPINFNVTIPAGQTYSFQIFNNGGVNYTDGTTLGALYNANADLEVYQGYGGTGFAGMVNQPRVFNGIVHYSAGCSAPRTQVVATVNTAPPMSATATSGGVTCNNVADSLVITSPNTSYTYLWTPNTGLADSTALITAANPQTTTTYYLAAIDSANCQAFDTVTIVVNASPIINLTSSDSVICYGDSATLAVASGPYFYTDSTVVNVPDSDPLGIDANPITASGVAGSFTTTSIDSVCFNLSHTWDSDMSFYLVSPLGTQMLLMENEGGSNDNFVNTCFSPNALVSVTGMPAPFTGTYLPEDPIGFSVFNGENGNGSWTIHMMDDAGGDLGTLANWSIWFTAPNYTYSWNSSGGPLGNTTSSITVNPLTTTTYYITATDSVNGCEKMDTVTLAVYNQLALNPFASPALVCTGGTDTLIANPTGGSGVYSYLWSDGLGTNDTATVTGLPFDYTVGVTLTDVCGVITDSVLIDIVDPLSITSTDTAHCGPGTGFVLSSNVTGGNGVNGYSWTGGSTSSTSTTGLVSGTTSYTVTVTDGCGTTATSVSTVTINTPPTVNLGADIVQVNPPAVLNAGSGFSSYLWSTSAVTQTISVSTNGTYTVTVTDGNGCTGTDAIQVTFTAGINNPDGSTATVSYYPNPTNGILNMNIQGFMGKELKMEVMDLEGRIIRNFVIGEVTENFISQIDLSTVSAGTYLVVLRTATDTYTHRIVITTQY